jgi:hypothetical protein
MQGFRMVHFAIFFGQTFLSFLLLNDKSHFCCDAKVSNGFKLVVFGLLALGGLQRGQLIGAHQAQVHDVADVQVVDPVILLTDAQGISD